MGGGDDDDIGTQTSPPYFRDGRPSEMMMESKHHASSVGFPDSGGVKWGVGMMTTLVHRHPEQYLHKSRFTRYLQYFRTEGSAGDSAPDSKLSGPKELQSFLDFL